MGTLQTYLTTCSSRLASSSACSISVTSWGQTGVRVEPHAALPTLRPLHQCPHTFQRMTQESLAPVRARSSSWLQ